MARRRRRAHFALTKKSRDFTLADLPKTEDEAFQFWLKLRYPPEGSPHCDRDECVAHRPPAYFIKTRRIFKCQRCGNQFSVTTNTAFERRKLSFLKIINALYLFATERNGVPAVRLTKRLGVTYMTAFVLSHKMREAMEAQQANQILNTPVEVDGQYFGGYVKPANEKANRIDRRVARALSGRVKVVVCARERKRHGRTLTRVFASEGQSIPWLRQCIAPKSRVHTDDANHWKFLQGYFDHRVVRHKQHYSGGPGQNTNRVESNFAGLRRMEKNYKHISGHLAPYAAEGAWREDTRRLSDRKLVEELARNLISTGPSIRWKRYWG